MADFIPGETRMMQILNDGESCRKWVAVTFNERGVSVRYPYEWDDSSLSIISSKGRTPPEPLYLLGHGGTLLLLDGRSDGVAFSWPGFSEDRWSYSTAFEGVTLSVLEDRVSSLSCRLEGLERWMCFEAVDMDNKDPALAEGVFTFKITKFGPLELCGGHKIMVGSFSNFDPNAMKSIYDLRAGLTVYSRPEEPLPFRSHVRQLQMLQELVSIAYGKPCELSLENGKLAGLEESLPSKVYSPKSGRKTADRLYVTSKDYPLFSFPDVNPEALDRWCRSYDDWSRPVWIIAATLFQQDLLLELEFISLAMALEALGYAIRKRDGKKTKYVKFSDHVMTIIHSLSFDPPGVFQEGQSAEEWAEKFSRVYNGIKHADNQMPDVETIHSYGRNAMMLFRCWLASELGVSREALRIH